MDFAENDSWIIMMSISDKVPVLAESGSDGKQIAANVVVEELPDNNLGGRPLLAEIEGVASRGRGFGNGMGNALIVGTIRSLDAQCRKAEAELRRRDSELESVRSRLSASETQCAILKERLDSLRRVRNLANAAMVIGSLLVGVGFDMAKEGGQAVGIPLMLFGGALVVLSWVSSSRSANA